MRVRAAAGLVAAVIVLGLAFGVHGVVRQPEDGTTTAQPPKSALLARLDPLMSQAQVVRLLGTPETFYRNSQQAQCWRYKNPIVQVCFGPTGRLAWWGGSPYSTIRPSYVPPLQAS